MDQAAAAGVRHISVAIRADGFFLTTPAKHFARRSQVILPAYAAPVEAVLAIEFAFVVFQVTHRQRLAAGGADCHRLALCALQPGRFALGLPADRTEGHTADFERRIAVLSFQ